MEDVMDTTNPPTTIKCWVDLYSDKMFSWAFHKTGSKETAEDLVQDTFLAAVNAFDKFEGKSNPKTWLFSILNNKIVDLYRKEVKNPVTYEASYRNPEGTSFFDTLFDENDGWQRSQAPGNWGEIPENLLDDKNFVDILQLCMGKLPVNWNAAMRLKYLEEKKPEQICQELSIATTNYWQMLHRAKLQLRKCLETGWFKKK